MTQPQDAVAIEDPPRPELPELQQRELPYPAVAVQHEGPIHAQVLPSRAGPAFTVALSTTAHHVQGNDPRRARTLMISAVAWRYHRGRSGEGVPWPANVPMEITHHDEVWASVPTDVGTLSVISQYWAD